MANPTLVTLTTADTWYKVAIAVTTGMVYAQKTAPKYKWTYRLAGDTAPSGSVSDELPFNESLQAEIDHSEPIDVYVKADEDGATVVVAL